MSDQSKFAGTTAARLVRSITAWSKLILGAPAKAGPTRRAPRSTVPSSIRARTAASASGACSFRSRRWRHRRGSRICQHSRGSPRRSAPPPAPRPVSRQNGRPRAPPGRSVLPSDVPERRGGPGRVHPEHDDPPALRERCRLGDRGMKCFDVGDQMIGRDHQDDRLRIAPRRQAGGQRTAASVSRACGSSAICSSSPRSSAWSSTRNRDSADVITIGSAKRAPVSRCEGALERRRSAEDRDVLLGEFLPRHGPEPRTGPSTQDGGDDRPDFAEAGVAEMHWRCEGHVRSRPFVWPLRNPVSRGNLVQSPAGSLSPRSSRRTRIRYPSRM